MRRYHVKAEFSGTEWGKVYGFVYAENKEAALKAATDGDVEWEQWKVYDSEVNHMDEYEVLGEDPE